MSCSQAPTWLRDELKDGIKKDKNFDVDDGISSVDESAGSDLEEEVFVKPKKEIATKKATISQGKPYAKYRTKTKGGPQTKNVAGVASATPADDVSVNSNYESNEFNAYSNARLFYR